MSVVRLLVCSCEIFFDFVGWVNSCVEEGQAVPAPVVVSVILLCKTKTGGKTDDKS
jgi:hypothetical protein